MLSSWTVVPLQKTEFNDVKAVQKLFEDHESENFDLSNTRISSVANYCLGLQMWRIDFFRLISVEVVALSPLIMIRPQKSAHIYSGK